MDNDLPDNFDLVVIGTGMKESVIAAAASRIGKRVLHIDKNDFYGGLWASFNIEGIEKHILQQEKRDSNAVENNSTFISDGENLVPIDNNFKGLINVKQHWHIPKAIIKNEEISSTQMPTEIDKEVPSEQEKVVDVKTAEEIEKDIENDTEDVKTTEEIEKDVEKDAEENNELSDKERKNKELWTQNKIYDNNRKFNLDLTPKLQFARGDFVELLISSNIARYCEYKSCTRVLTWINDHLEIVPCSRSDVFSNTNVTVVEKRMLMKILSTCMDNDEEFFAGYRNKTFLNFLKDKKLTPNLIHYILYAISMSDQSTPCLEAVKRTKRFLNSLGRFGKTPFICSMYGSGELPQAFCRLSAVFGGIYCLNRNIDSLIFNNDDICTSVICGKQKITADNFVLSFEHIPEKYISDVKTENISRAIFITNKSILESDKENLTLLIYPSENGKSCITIIELGPSTGTCPQNLYIVHAYCKQMTNPEEDLKHCIEKLFKTTDVHPDDTEEDTNSPQVLWSLYFTCSNATFDETKLPKNLYSCGGPDLDLDYDNTIKEAKDIFLRIYPENEFLPRAPDPEEIVLYDDDDNETKEENTNANSLVATTTENKQETEQEEVENKEEEEGIETSADTKNIE